MEFSSFQKESAASLLLFSPAEKLIDIIEYMFSPVPSFGRRMSSPRSMRHDVAPWDLTGPFGPLPIPFSVGFSSEVQSVDN